VCFTAAVTHICKLGFVFLVLLHLVLWYVLMTPIRSEREMLWSASSVVMIQWQCLYWHVYIKLLFLFLQSNIQLIDCYLLTFCPNNTLCLENGQKVYLLLYLTTENHSSPTPHPDWAAQCLPFLQFAISRSPHVLVQCIAVSIVLGFYLPYLKKHPRSAYF